MAEILMFLFACFLGFLGGLVYAAFQLPHEYLLNGFYGACLVGAALLGVVFVSSCD